MLEYAWDAVHYKQRRSRPSSQPTNLPGKKLDQSARCLQGLVRECRDKDWCNLWIEAEVRPKRNKSGSHRLLQLPHTRCARDGRK